MYVPVKIGPSSSSEIVLLNSLTVIALEVSGFFSTLLL